MNQILKRIEGEPDHIKSLCLEMFCRGIRSVTGAGLQEIKYYVKDHPDLDTYDVKDMAKEFKKGKI